MRIALPSVVTRTFGRQILQVQKYSPQIMFAAGVVGVTASAVMACRATLKVEAIVKNAEEHRHSMTHARENRPADYSVTDHKKDLALLRIHVIRDFAKIYGPSVVLGVSSLGLLTGSHIVLNRRYASMTAAYSLVDKAFREYRARVVEQLGEERDLQFRHGSQTIVEKVQGPDGAVKKKISRVGDGTPSQYARFFDEYCQPWKPQPEYNAVFLRAQQQYCNDLLNARGHLFLNEVYDALGLPRSSAGAIVGWVVGKGDPFVDFGIFDDHTNSHVRDFVNGREASILLDFNVAGPIWDLI